ncbi:ATP-binding cassette domain-containing protein [Fusibacter paucivorans]|uniref:ATP-binding cassette domain-containing protein n=1 Tax=Fusibacter paucivorans TaxID=76009 RepID=A0ABS5PJW6_9FIRM|nr:oligopeptide/dipeptide ABC transporter ATP-binding protein [Fusibacter paucivorans]MBS7525373.1 ATP-binding cassette domain-containing protein [Fusibacter paucivorans]
MKQPIIEIEHLKKYFPVKEGKLHALDDISLSIFEGQTLGVVGESGCGKSTLGRTLLRLVEPTDGIIRYDGRDITKLNRKELADVRRDMQIIFQDPYASLNPRMTVKELIAEPLIVNKIISNKKELMKEVDRLMALVGLSQRLSMAYPHELDGGRRQRIGIARAIAMKPRFIVCDEPVSALDVSIQAQILNLLMDLQAELSLTYLFITHDLSVVRHISTNIAVMYLGQCVEMAPSKVLFKNPVHPYTKALLSAIPIPSSSMRHKAIETVKGEVVSPINPLPGCRFAQRCPGCGEQCAHYESELIEVEPKHFVACPSAVKAYMAQK